MTAPLMHEPVDVADLPLIAVCDQYWSDLYFDPRLVIEHDPDFGEVRIVGTCSFVRAGAVA